MKSQYIVRTDEYVEENHIVPDTPTKTTYSEVFSSRKEAEDYIHNFIIEDVFDEKLRRNYDLTSNRKSDARVYNEYSELILSCTIFELVRSKS